MTSHRRSWTQTLSRFAALSLVGLGLGACFDGLAVEGLPCEFDSDCGPLLFCVGEPGSMICAADPFSPTTTNASGESESESSTTQDTETDTDPSETDTDPTDTDPTDTDPTDTDTGPTDTDTGPDTDGECLEPIGECASSTVPMPIPEDALDPLIERYCENFTMCGCTGFADYDECYAVVSAQFQSEAALAGDLGAELDAQCIGFRMAFMSDMGCRPVRGVNPRLETQPGCDALSCSLWSGTTSEGSSCGGGGVGGDGNPITSTCEPGTTCQMDVCVNSCSGLPDWVEAPGFEPPGQCTAPGQCSVCNACVEGQCSSAQSLDCVEQSDCAPAHYCTPQGLCEPRHQDFECCEADPQCLSNDCKDGACMPAPYICEMPFPSPDFMF